MLQCSNGRDVLYKSSGYHCRGDVLVEMWCQWCVTSHKRCPILISCSWLSQKRILLEIDAENQHLTIAWTVSQISYNRYFHSVGVNCSSIDSQHTLLNFVIFHYIHYIVLNYIRLINITWIKFNINKSFVFILIIRNVQLKFQVVLPAMVYDSRKLPLKLKQQFSIQTPCLSGASTCNASVRVRSESVMCTSSSLNHTRPVGPTVFSRLVDSQIDEIF